MRTKGWTLGLFVFAGLALMAVVMTLAASPAGATITGTPLPTYGNDWVIDQDTTVLGESIRLQGVIDIEPGNTLSVRNSEIKINSTFPGEHGIYIGSNSSSGDGAVVLDDVTLRADTEENGFFFNVDGGLKITKARLYNVEYGLQIYNDNVDIVNMTLYAQGYYGVRIYRADPKIHSSEIYAQGYPGSMVTGLSIQGDSSDRAAPDLDDLTIKVSMHHDIESTSSYTYVYFDMLGVECYYAQFANGLRGIDLSFEATADVFVNYSYNPYVRVYYNVYGFQFSGGTILGGLNVTLSDSIYHVDADSVAPSGYLYMYNYWRGLQNYIDSNGKSPDVFSGFSAVNQHMTWNTNQVFTERPYYYGMGFSWYPSHSAGNSDTITVDGITLDGIEVQEMVDMDMGKKHVVKNCLFRDSYIDDYMVDYYGMDYDAVWSYNDIINNTMTSNQMIRQYYGYGLFTFRNNDVLSNTYYRFLYAYYNYEDIYFRDNNFVGNDASYGFAYIYRNQAPFEFTGNTWQGNTNAYYFMYMSYPYYAFEFSKNTWWNESSTDRFFYPYYTQGNAALDFIENTFLGCNFGGGFLWSQYQNSLWTLEDNVFDGCSFSQRGVIWLYGDINGGGYDITGNTFVNNSGAGSYFLLYGFGYWGTRTFIFERNTFINNTATTASTGGILYFYKTRQDYAVRDCVFINNSANCIVVFWTYQYYSTSYKNNMFFEDNTFINNTGKCIAYSESSDTYLTIRGNKGYGNEDYVVWIDHRKGYQYYYNEADHTYITSYAYPRGPLELIIEANNFSYNPGGGIWAAVSEYDSSYSSYNPGQPNAEIRVKKNMLYGNGPDGWSLALDHLYKKPTVKDNFLEGSSMGQLWGLIQGDGRATPFEVEVRGVHIDGGSEGKTALGFNNIDAEIYDCMFVNFTECIYAVDCEVNVYWSGVPEASGKTEGDGEIYVWNHLEIWVTWANASAVDSGIPAPGAIVAIQGANGAYFGALKTDEQGRLYDKEGDPMVVTPWTCVKGVMDAWSPFTITLLAQENVSTAHKVRLTQDYIDPHPLRLTLNDMFVPEVIISNPQDDTLVNVADVLHEGFLFEIGSGIVVFEGRTDMMPEDEWVTLTQNVLWQHVFHGMTEGYHNVSVRAADLSGNWNTSNIEIIVDLTIPDLFVKLEYLNATAIPYDPVQGGYFVRDREIIVNGTYGDNYAGDGEIIIRINGKVLYIFESQWGTIYERVELAQGINTLIVDATDTAGNRNSNRKYVSLDSFPPTMYIYNPLDNMRTANETLMVTGLTEPLTRLDIIVQSSAGTNTYRTTSQSDGTFEFPVELFENIQKVLVTATDPAGNPTLIDLNVILDTTPPDFIINQPPEEYVVTKETRYNIVGTMTFDPEADVYIGGQKVPNIAVFQREVVLQEGENIIDIVAIDEVGNQKTKYVTIVRDTVAPELEVTEPEEDYIITNDPTIPFHGYVEGSMGVVIKHKSIRLPAELVAGSWETGEWKYDLELGPNDLEQDVEVIAFDLAENEDIKIVHIKLDIVPPSLAIDDVPDNVDTPFVWINGTTDGNIAFVYVQGVPYSVISGAFEIQWSLAAGENNLNVEVKDEAGNVASNVVTTTYYQEVTKPPEEDNGGGGPDILSIIGISLLLVAIVVLVTALFVVYSRRRR